MEKTELERLRALREAVRPLIEGLYRVPKRERYWLNLKHPAIEKLGQAFKEAHKHETDS